MDSFWWLIIANAVVWLGLGGYLAFLGAVQKNLGNAIRAMGMQDND